MPNIEMHDVPLTVETNLKQRVLRGVAAIAIRQGIGMGLSVINVLLVTRIIGPTQYGIFAASYGIVSVIATAGTWGLDVYLLRKDAEPSSAEYNQAFTIFLATGIFFVAVLVLFHRSIAVIVGIPALSLPLAIMSLFIPFNLINVPGVVQLDRGLQFNRVARVELAGQAAGYLVAVPLALCHMGCWAPILGVLTGQFLALILVYVFAPMRLWFHWERGLARRMLAYGLSYSGAIMIWQLRLLVNPLVVGRFAGAQGVGFVALAIRLVEVLAFVKQATWRVAMAALAKLDGDSTRLRRSISEGMRLQAIAVGLPLTIFAGVGPILLPYIFGPRWNPAFKLFPFIALSYLISATFNLHTSVLALLRHNLEIMKFHVAHVFLFASVAVLLVPRFGYIGYGWAEIGAFASYYLLHRYISERVNSPDYRSPLIWCLVCCMILVICGTVGKLGIVSLVLLPVPLLFAREREYLEVYVRILMRDSIA